MKVLILHGIGGHAGIHWQQWLHDELSSLDVEVLMPELPDSNHPDRQEWLKVIKEATENEDLSRLIIVGHSLGATAALDFIESLDQPIEGLISVSGFSVDYGAELNSYYLKEKSINFEQLNSNLKWASVIYGDNDPYVTQDALMQLAQDLKVEAIVIPNGGHLNTEAGFTTFPELIKIVKEKVKP
jgi:predicted alpha/beta hydrolase family esterase